MTQQARTITVNGDAVAADSLQATVLIHALREDLGLRGVRSGCAIGECGACTVLVDGAPVRSCITPVDEVVGHEVVTPEGLGTPDAPHPLQRGFIDAQAAQCGYCVNGIIMTLAGLDGAGTTEDELTDALDEHLCRCGTHSRLRAAARRAVGLDAGRHGDDPGLLEAGPAVPDPAPSAEELPAFIAANPRLEQWITLGSDGCIHARAGKVELGQGIRTAFAQIVAAQIGVPVDHVHIDPTRTDHTPDQWFTAGSLSIEDGGTALAVAATAARRVILARAAELLGAAPETLTLDGDGVHGGGRSLDLAAIAADGPLEGVIGETDRPRWDLPAMCASVPRTDLDAKLTGAGAFLQDLVLPQMAYARMAFPPTPDARLEAVDETATRALPGVIDVVIDGRVALVITERDDQAIRAVSRLARDLTWDAVALEVPADLYASFRDEPSEPFEVRRDEATDELIAGSTSHRATYTSPYQAHGSMAPSVGIARVDDDGIQVWAHSQGVHPLKRELAALYALDPDTVIVEHVDGPGCYGMNGGDDAAAIAVRAAQALPGRPVRFQFSIQDEFGWEPYGPAMVVDMEAGVDDDGRLTGWRHRTISGAHMNRPNGKGNRLVPSWLREGGEPRGWPGAGEGGGRNTRPLYDVAALEAVADHVRGPLRTAALRCLGAYTNLFAGESFVDELADLAGVDPVEFRLAHISDPRARAVLEVAAERSGWQPHIGPSGRGMGVAVAQYKESKAYIAQVAEVEIDPDQGIFRVIRILVVADAGRVINPDGARNQLEGGTLQGLSRAMFERLTPSADGVRERDWTTYPVLRFRDVPELDVHILSRPGHRALGVAESSTPTVPAVIANAIDDAIGIRLRDLPLTAAQLQRRLLEMSDDEAARVLL